MTETNPAPAVSTESLIARVQGILLSPKAEWEKIEPEQQTTQGLFMGYAGILAAIPAIAQLINGLFPHCFLGVCIHQNLIAVAVGAIVLYLLSLGGVFVISIVIDELAPSFGGTKNRIQALKLVVYSWTAFWIAGIFNAVPFLGILSLVGLYSLYLLYLGVPVMMKAPQDKALGYTVVSIIVGIIVYFVVAAVAAAVVGSAAMFGASTIAANPYVSGSVRVGGASVDLGQLGQAAQQAEAAGKALQAQANGQPAPAGSVQALPADALKAMLPEALPTGFARTEISASSGGAAGVSGSNAQGVYTKGDSRITLEVTDMAAMGALASMATAFNVQSDKETATGYEKVSTVNGRMTDEEFDNQDKSGKFSVLVGNRFVVEANGSGVAIDDLKAAVQSVDLNRLQSMVHT
jgi:hypothetical protein